MLLEMFHQVAQSTKTTSAAGMMYHLFQINFKMCRNTMSRVMFTTGAKFVGWAECMDTCPKYNRAQAPSIASGAGLQELVSWTHTTIRDPDTLELYPGVGRFQGLWLPYR